MLGKLGQNKLQIISWNVYGVTFISTQKQELKNRPKILNNLAESSGVRPSIRFLDPPK